MKQGKYVQVISFFIVCGFNNVIIPTNGHSQTESYLNALAPTRKEAYAKIKNFLTAPPVEKGTAVSGVDFFKIDVQAFEPFINQAIETEKNNPGYYALYHASQKEGFLMVLMRTYINQIENNWSRDNFFMVRPVKFFYKQAAKSAEDYIKQNIPNIMRQFTPISGSFDKNCTIGKGDFETGQDKRYHCDIFDMHGEPRNHLVSTSPAFVAGVDDTSYTLRSMSELGYAAWESSFYYFAAGLSWSNVKRLYTFMVEDLKNYYLPLFNNTEANVLIRKYVAIKFSRIVELLFPHPYQGLTAKQTLHSKAGMMFQFLIPKNIIDDVAYLSWQNGIVWRRTINDIQAGWDDTIAAYVKLGPILDILQTDPKRLGRSINLLQARIILKDEKYFNDPRSPIKINLIHSLPPSLFRSIEETLKAIARVIVENKKADQKGEQQSWLEQVNLAKEMDMHEEKLEKLLSEQDVDSQIKALDTLYYFVVMGADFERAAEIANKHKSSGNNELKKLSEEILASISATQKAWQHDLNK